MKVGDVVPAAAGKPIAVVGDALAAIRSHKVGDKITLMVVGPEPDAQPRTFTPTLAPRPDDATRPFLGVTMQTKAQNFDLPFKVNIDAGRVGGPSAGLAFTLAILDELTQGELTGGKKVAATGWFTVGFAPMMTTTSALVTSITGFETAPEPMPSSSATTDDAWHSRVQWSTLLLPKPGRTSSGDRSASSLLPFA